jgi:hypothetical protein
METSPTFELLSAKSTEISTKDPSASPFRVVIDPALRLKLRQALLDLINNHEETLAQHVVDGRLSIDSYKEYIELYALSLKETMGSVEGVTFLLQRAGFEIPADSVNLKPEWRWKSA